MDGPDELSPNQGTAVERFRGSKSRMRRLKLTRREKWQGAWILLFLVLATIVSLVAVGKLEGEETHQRPLNLLK